MTRLEKAQNLVSQMTLEEKISLLSGLDCWHTKPVARLNLPSIMVSDGPHGLRKQAAAQDNFGVGESIKATCFPTASLSACSFDEDLLFEMGKALAEECIKEDVSVILGPGINMKRSPLCGRNFEYFAEDPYAAGKLSAAFIKGVQSLGVGTSLKHFAVNSQEKRRMSISAEVDKRTLFEYYLKAFEIAVTEAQPWTVMCSYNRINGTYASENKSLLTDTLRNKWGFNGLTVSDWGAVHIRSEGVKAGLDLEMPGNKGLNDKKVLAAVKDGTLSETAVDQCACRVTELVLKAKEERQSLDKNKLDSLFENHHNLAVKIAENSMVLLKNDENLLPLNNSKKILLLGAFADTPRFQGAGSSRINPIKLSTPLETFTQNFETISYAQGYRLDGKEDNKLLEEAIELCKNTDHVIIFAGLPSSSETEGLDRTTLSMPENQNKFIETILEICPNAVIVLMGGAPFVMPWINKAKAVLLSYLGGEGLGQAVFNIITGLTNPSGKLSETWPCSLDDCLSSNYFPGDCKTVQYRESIYTGYRYFDTVSKKVQFSFGHGLSYTSFSYSNLAIDINAEQKLAENQMIDVSVDITNNGRKKGSETAFVFASFPDAAVFTAKHNLSAFKKIFLEPGETKTVLMKINPRELSWYDPITEKWQLHQGTIILSAGGNLENLTISKTINSPVKKINDTENNSQKSAYEMIASGFEASNIPDEDFKSLLGRNPTAPVTKITKPFTMENCILDTEHTFFGRILKEIIIFAMKIVSRKEKDQLPMMTAAALEMPLFGLPPASNGLFPERIVRFLLKLFNL